MTVTKVSVQDQQGSESAYSDPKTKPKYVEKYTKYKQWEVTIVSVYLAVGSALDLKLKEE